MIKKFLKFGDEQKGSALLITLLMLGILMTLTLGISNLVIREIAVTQSLLDANKTFYAAEGGVERAVLALKNGGPGVEPKLIVKGDCGSEPDCVALSDELKALDPAYAFQYSVNNQSETVPAFAENKPIFVQAIAESSVGAGGASIVIPGCQISNSKNPFAIAMDRVKLYTDCPRATYKKLALNETNIIPLFAKDSAGASVKVENFIIQYYTNYSSGASLLPFIGNSSPDLINKIDVLRWKIYGQPEYEALGEAQRTESIADFYPAMENTDAMSPVCIGTDPSVAILGQSVTSSCKFPALSKPKDLEGGLEDALDKALWGGARECYRDDAGGVVTGGKDIKGTAHGDNFGCTMKEFIQGHKDNYLVLTNMVNPDVVGITDVKNPDQLARADIYYRIVAESDATVTTPFTKPKLVKDFAEISAQGLLYKGDLTVPAVVKTLESKYKAAGFLPVFNFSLYKVCDSNDKDSKTGMCKYNDKSE